ncbi:MAG: hypothetical protein K6B28_03745 [Lachnospiraceae bacterium]|nr:hypothetical protein [Lachnospiraceae bacterium]
MNNSQGSAIVLGLFIGILIVIVLIKTWNKDGRLKTQYDEMQEKARGLAYKYAFWTIVFVEAVMIVLMSFGIKLPFDNITVHIIPILIGTLVQASYSLWHNAYAGLNTNMKRFGIISIVIAGVNFLVALIAIFDGRMIVNGIFEFPLTNLICGFLFVIIGIESVIKNHLDNKDREED